MDIGTINGMIDELERSEPSLSNIRNLSALYIVRDQLLTKTIQADKPVKELRDILPSYQAYIEEKKKYQLNEGSLERVCNALGAVLAETWDFVHALYKSTDTEQERMRLRDFRKHIQKITI